MRKAVVALGTIGIGAGILYAVGRAREKNVAMSPAMNEGVENVGDGENQTPHWDTSGRGSETTSETKLPSMSPLEDDLKRGLTIEELE